MYLKYMNHNFAGNKDRLLEVHGLTLANYTQGMCSSYNIPYHEFRYIFCRVYEYEGLSSFFMFMTKEGRALTVRDQQV